MQIVVDESLKAYIDPLTADEHAALEQSILAEGCRDALVLWGDILVDGHNRYGICSKHGLPFQTVQNTRFKSMEDVHLWMIDQHLGRRSISDFQRGVLALRRREILEAREPAPVQHEAAEATPDGEGDTPPWDPNGPAPAPAQADSTPAAPKPGLSRQDLARAARLSNNQMGMIERIQKQAAPEVVAAVRSGVLSINAAAAVATLPEEEQKLAAEAGDEELRQAAKRAREAKRRPRKPRDEDAQAGDAAAAEPAPAADGETIASLQARVDALTSENATLRERIAELEAQLGQ